MTYIERILDSSLELLEREIPTMSKRELDSLFIMTERFHSRLDFYNYRIKIDIDTILYDCLSKLDIDFRKD